MSTYQLGAYADGVNALKDMVQITGVDPQPSEFLEFSEEVGTALSGKPIEAGAPSAKWQWEYLEQISFSALAQYCTGTSSVVYIRTRGNTGTSYSFGVFKAIMHRPRGATVPGNLRRGVEVLFTGLETR